MDPVFSERFQREANIVGQLSHPNIVSIYDIGRHQNLNYIAMDYLPGGSAHDKMTAGISPQETLRITREIANALDHAHEKGYIHRDIKPENILFREDDSAVLTDFGVAKTLSTASRMTHAGTVVGTPHYMSPEQTRGKPVDGRADIYSLGVVFYEMLTGSVPFQAEEAVAIAIKHLTAPIPKLPPQYQAYQKILNQLLAKDPDKRFQRGRDLVAAIDALQQNNNPLQPGYATSADSTSVQILSLFKALLATSYMAICIQMGRFTDYLRSWRWTPRRGLYRHPRVTVTQVQAGDEEKATVISTRVQQAAHYQSMHLNRSRWFSRSLTLVIMLSLIWGAFSVALHKYELPGEQHVPDNIAGLAQLTAQWIGTATSFTDDSNEVATAPASEVADNDTYPFADEIPEVVEAPGADATAGIPVAGPAPRHPLRVNAVPQNARVRILNITERYYPGIELLPGRSHIEVSHNGYDTHSEWIEIEREPVNMQVSLLRTPIPGATFFNDLGGGVTGPEMIIVAPGSFTMGSRENSNSMPERRVRIERAFAIGRFEITFADYEKFAQATDRPMPDDNRWGRGNRPVINVSWQDAQDYVAWLARTSGAKYRLPTEAEWEYIARAGTDTAFWWGNSSTDGSGRANCRRGCDSNFAGIFTSRSAPVGSYPPNPFGVYSTAGNVAEWVQDCYQVHYLGAPRDGRAVQLPECSNRVVRGGSLISSVTELTSHARSGEAPNTRSTSLGFRVAVELY
jgi:serine/threonine-protein kinase PpkA